MFRTDLLSIIRNLNTVYTAIGIHHTGYVDCLPTRSGPDHARRQSTELAWHIPIAVYTVLRILMKDSACPKHVEFFTYLLTPWCRDLLEKLTGLQLVKKFPAFHGTRRFIIAHTSVRHLSLFCASPIQSIYPHPISWRSILISTHLHLGLPSGLLPSGFPAKTLYAPLTSPIRATCPAM